MNSQEAPSPIDDLLLPFLRASDEQESQKHLELLLTRSAEPVLRSIVKQKLKSSSGGGPGDAGEARGIEDLCGEVLVQLLARVREFKANPNQKPIADFRGYVAVVAYNACHEHMRQKYPRRYSLRNRMRYRLSHSEQFGIWEREGELHCGFARWANNNSTRAGSRRLRELLDSPRAFDRSALADRDLQNLSLSDLLNDVFESVGSPVELDELVNAVAFWSGTRDEVSASNIDEGGAESQRQLADTRAGIDVEVERRIYVQRLWSEICQLPQRQREALLLNLKNARGDDCIALFPLSGVATPQDIAHSLDISAEEFAELWNDLPLDDAAIASRLGITRQQVINLRKSARERLARRMKAFEEGM